MPISKRVARFNKRVTNRITRHMASWMRGVAIVAHVGRRSGRLYRTPVNVFRDGDRYLFALTYGNDFMALSPATSTPVDPEDLHRVAGAARPGL